MTNGGRDNLNPNRGTEGGKGREPASSTSDDDNAITEEEEKAATEAENNETNMSTDTEPEEPERWTGLKSFSPNINVDSKVRLNATPDRVPSDETIQPQGASVKIGEIGVRTAANQLELTSDCVPTEQIVRPEGKLRREGLTQFTTVDSININRMKEETNDPVKIGTELFEMDPVHQWIGHPPYNTGRPSVIIHVSPTNGQGASLAFLERRLRDEYTQRRGGEPVGKTVGFIGGKPNIPAISGNIVTFDLTRDSYTISTDAGEVRVERNGTDILEHIEDSVRTGYTGELGYLILNVPMGWQDPFVYDDVFDQVQNRIAPDGLNESGADTDDSRWRPVVTRCQWGSNTEAWDESEFAALAKRYWFGHSRTDTAEAAAVIEAREEAFDRERRRYDWLVSALTKEDDSESDEHYLLKGAITAGMTRTFYQECGSFDSFPEFVFEKLSTGGPVATEAEDGHKKVDIKLSPADRKQRRAVKDFTHLKSVDSGSIIAIEVETGRSEADTNFRKIWKTIDRLCEDGPTDIDWVLVAIPPRLLMHTRGQARHILGLADRWNQKVDITDNDEPKTAIVVPQFNRNKGCVGLRSGEAFCEEVYTND